MEEEINAEKLEELLGMNMSVATEAIKEQYMNRAKQQYFQTPVSFLTVKQDEPELGRQLHC